MTDTRDVQALLAFQQRQINELQRQLRHEQAALNTVLDNGLFSGNRYAVIRDGHGALEFHSIDDRGTNWLTDFRQSRRDALRWVG